MLASAEPNKRKLFRFPCTLGVEAFTPQSADAVGMALRNVSWAGLRMASPRPVRKGEHLEVRIPLVDPQYSIGAEVIWCQAVPEGAPQAAFEVGVQFRGGNCLLDETMYSHLREIETYRQTVSDVEGRELSSDDAAREWRDRFSDRLFA